MLRPILAAVAVCLSLVVPSVASATAQATLPGSQMQCRYYGQVPHQTQTCSFYGARRALVLKTITVDRPGPCGVSALGDIQICYFDVTTIVYDHGRRLLARTIEYPRIATLPSQSTTVSLPTVSVVGTPPSVILPPPFDVVVQRGDCTSKLNERQCNYIDNAGNVRMRVTRAHDDHACATIDDGAYTTCQEQVTRSFYDANHNLVGTVENMEDVLMASPKQPSS